MITLRLLALFTGAMVLVVPPMVLGQSQRGLPGWVAVGALFGLALIASSFFYVGAAGDRMRRPGFARTLGGLLLSIPAVASIVMLAIRDDPPALWSSGALLCLTVLLFISFVYPASMDRRQRPMRLRERSEPTLRVVHRG